MRDLKLSARLLPSTFPDEGDLATGVRLRSLIVSSTGRRPELYLADTIAAIRELGRSMRYELRYILSHYSRDLARRIYEHPHLCVMTFAMARQEFRNAPNTRRLFRGPLHSRSRS